MSLDLNALVDELTGEEGLRLTVYDDATGQPLRPGVTLKGHPTIGIGRALDTNGISKDEAAYLLRNDIAKVAAELQHYEWFNCLDSVRQNTLADMSFNLGLSGLLAFHKVLECLDTRDYDAAANSMLASQWAKQVPSRAARLAQQMRTGLFQGQGQTNV